MIWEVSPVAVILIILPIKRRLVYTNIGHIPNAQKILCGKESFTLTLIALFPKILIHVNGLYNMLIEIF